MARVTLRQIRRMIARTSMGDRPETRRLRVQFKFRNPRLYDDFTDFEDVKEDSGVYVIYCTEKRRTLKTKVSRILYIGRGWIGDRLLWHKLNKKGLERFAREHVVKFAFVPIHDYDGEFIVEGVLLLEHERTFGCLPYFNSNRGSSKLYAWHDVTSLQPGPRRILNKYGA